MKLTYSIPFTIASRSSDRRTGSNVVYPYASIQTSSGGVLVEHVYRDDFVFVRPEEYVLASFTSHGKQINVSFMPACKGYVAELKLNAGPNAIHCYELPELGERANYRQLIAHPQYVQLRRSLSDAYRSGKGGGGLPWWGTALLLVLGLLSSILLFSSQGAAIPDAMTPLPVVKHDLVAVPSAKLSSQLDTAEKSILARVVKESGIELQPGGTPFVVFSDPNCPACRELEGRLEALDKSFSPLIVPVSFKKDSKAAVSGILCSKDAVSAWKSAVSGGVIAPGCAAGDTQAETNNTAFLALRFDSTPTIVTANGKIAVGAKDFDGLMRWVKENSHE